ncbi:uncharacterized protein LOC124924569 [Impatiens glandulifera]|uniref:uncharacterized protein LOC124924569 n=1 Tax=Impatiens glandulifera TaxID=253017 RepID=UPI001FB06A6A|nr:uncharacterized protein LOC124924569 [Impatiens glandulifera]
MPIGKILRHLQIPIGEGTPLSNSKIMNAENVRTRIEKTKERAPRAKASKEAELKISKDKNPKEDEPKEKDTAVKGKSKIKRASKKRKSIEKKAESGSHDSERISSPDPSGTIFKETPIMVVIPLPVPSNSPVKEKDAAEKIPSPRQAEASTSRAAKSIEQVSTHTHNSEIRKSPPKSIADTIESVRLRTSDVVLDVAKEVTQANNDEATSKIVEEGQAVKTDRLDDPTNETVNNEEEIPTVCPPVQEGINTERITTNPGAENPLPTEHSLQSALKVPVIPNTAPESSKPVNEEEENILVHGGNTTEKNSIGPGGDDTFQIDQNSDHGKLATIITPSESPT